MNTTNNNLHDKPSLSVLRRKTVENQLKKGQ